MPGSSRGSLGPVASDNVVRQQNGSLTMVKKASRSSSSLSTKHNNNNNSLMALGARGSVASAWQDSRSNLLEKSEPRPSDGPEATDQQARQMSAYRRWLSRNVANKVGQQQKRGGEGGDDRRFQPKYRETPGAAVILYLGIGMIVVGLVFTFVGLGDRVFHTLELQLIGPSLIAAGFVVCGIRVLVCACAGKCSYCDRVIVAEDGQGRRQSTDVSDDSWRPDSWKPQSASSVVVRRPPTPARVALERNRDRDRDDDDSASSSSSFQDASDPRDLLSIRSEDSSDYSLSEFQEIELQKAPPPEPETSWKGREGKRQEQDVAGKEQEASAGQGQRSIGKLEKKMSDGLILNVSTLQEERAIGGRQRSPEVDSEHSWNMETDAK